MSSKENKTYFWIMAVVVILYVRTVFFNFIYLDDQFLILDNYFFISKLSNIPLAFVRDVFISTFSEAYYRPILTVSLILDAQISGTKPFFYHISNISFHAIASALVYKFLNVLGIGKRASFFATLIFAVHPALVQAVAWIPGRNDSLLTIFFLASIINFVSYSKNNSLRSLITHFVFLILALLTKETAVFIPIVSVAYLYVYNKEKTFKQTFKLITFWFAVVIFWLVLRSQVFDNPLQITVQSVILSIVNNSPAALIYLGKVIFPVNLSTYPNLVDSSLLPGFIALLVLLVLVYYLYSIKETKAVKFSAIWLLTMAASLYRPSQGVAPDILEHRIYLPIIGIIILFAVLIGRRRRLRTLSLSIIILFSLATLIYQSNYQNRLTFWENAVANSPSSPLANRNLGAMYYLDNQYDQALLLFRRSLELNPDEPMANNNIGLIYLKRGEKQQALHHFQREIEINPYYSDVYNNLALLYVETGDYEKALENLKMVIKINPDNPKAYLYIAQIKAKNNDFGGALDYYLMAKRRGLTDPYFELLILQKISPKKEN